MKHRFEEHLLTWGWGFLLHFKPLHRSDCTSREINTELDRQCSKFRALLFFIEYYENNQYFIPMTVESILACSTLSESSGLTRQFYHQKDFKHYHHSYQLVCIEKQFLFALQVVLWRKGAWKLTRHSNYPYRWSTLIDYCWSFWGGHRALLVLCFQHLWNRLHFCRDLHRR